MSVSFRIFGISAIALAAACGSDMPTAGGIDPAPSLRVVNAFPSPVSVMIDGNVVISGLAAGSIGTALSASGSHNVTVMTPSGSYTQPVTITRGSLSTLAATRSSSGTIWSTVLDDTNSVVPAGATKVRVFHMAPNAGTLQVYRTQPDYQTPISWQFPFTYQATPNSLSAPFYQSTAATWEIRIWQTPADASGWASAPVKVTIPLGSGEKKTVLILDNPAGGVRVELM